MLARIERGQGTNAILLLSGYGLASGRVDGCTTSFTVNQVSRPLILDFSVENRIALQSIEYHKRHFGRVAFLDGVGYFDWPSSGPIFKSLRLHGSPSIPQLF
jgi:hypothetical protein